MENDNWTMDDFAAERCEWSQIGRPRTAPAEDAPPNPEAPDPLLSDLELARSLYRKDPKQFIQSHPSVANKLLEMEARREALDDGPPGGLDDAKGWADWGARLARRSRGSDSSKVASPVLLLLLLDEAGGSLSELARLLGSPRAS